MSTQQNKNPVEESLFNLLNEVQNFRAHCLGCRKVLNDDIEHYIRNTMTRAKLIICCSDHVRAMLFWLWKVIQDPSGRTDTLSLENISPEQSNVTSNALYNLPIYINAKCVRVLLATNKVIDPTTVATLLTKPGEAKDGEPNDLDKGFGLTPEGESLINRISERPLSKNDILQLDNSDSMNVLARGLAQMEIAQRALENACEEFQQLEGSRLSVRLSKSIQQRTKALHHSAKAISKFANENAPQKEAAGQEEEEQQKCCGETNSFVDGEVVKLMEEDPLSVMRPREKEKIGKTVAWFNTMELKKPK